MGRLRAGIVVSGLAGVGLLTLVLVNCAEPTQIVVEVYSDACTQQGSLTKVTTGIAVGTPAEIADKPPSTTRLGCTTPVSSGGAQRGVGTLTIYPSGEKDGEIAIKVLAGVDRPPDTCRASEGYLGCIAHRRVMHFIPNTTQRAIIRLSLKCLNIDCGAGKTCDDGQCKRDVDILEDGGTVPDAQTTEGSIVADGGALDGGADACTGCSDQCVDGECRVDCNRVGGCGTGELCAPTLPCSIKCGPGKDKCADIHCTTTAKCNIDCSGDKSCGKVTCNAKDCDVKCDGPKSCEQPVLLDGSVSAQLECQGDKACTTASCNSPSCELTCEPSLGACPDAGARPCTGGCQNWNNPDVR